jgi:hypothetical protein
MNGTARCSLNGFTSNSTLSGEDTPDSYSSIPQYPSHAIAIVGMAGRFPGADSLEELWEVISEGKVQSYSHDSKCGRH